MKFKVNGVYPSIAHGDVRVVYEGNKGGFLCVTASEDTVWLRKSDFDTRGIAIARLENVRDTLDGVHYTELTEIIELLS